MDGILTTKTRIVLELDGGLVALLCGTLMRAADQYPESENQRALFEAVESAVDNALQAEVDR